MLVTSNKISSKGSRFCSSKYSKSSLRAAFLSISSFTSEKRFYNYLRIFLEFSRVTLKVENIA